MIRKSQKKKLIEEIKKTGIVLLACNKVGIDKATHYRWMKSDAWYKKMVNEAMEIGDSITCDIAESTLVRKAKEGDLGASKYILSHRSKKYRKLANGTVASGSYERTLEDLLYESAARTKGRREEVERERLAKEAESKKWTDENGNYIYPWDRKKYMEDMKNKDKPIN